MNKIINRYQAVYGTTWLIIFAIMITLWPLRLVTEKIVSGSNRQISMSSEAITEDYMVQQMFVAQYDYLQNIKVYLLNESAGETFNFILYDASRNVLMQQFISTDNMEEVPGFCTIQVNQETEVGREYYYLLQGVSTDFYVAYEDTETSGTIYNGTLYYGNVEDTEHNIITEYEYQIPLRKGKTLVCDALLVMLGLLVTICAGKYYGRYPERNRLLTVEQVFKRTATPAVLVLALIGIIAVWPCQLFSEYAEQNLFFIAGIILAACIMLYGINRNRLHKSSDMGFSVLRDHFPDYLQAACFAFAIQAGVHYMNGLYEIHHTIAYREMLVWFGLAVIVTYKRKEILNAVNFVYLIIAGISGYLYYRGQVVSLDDDEKIQALKLTVWAAVIAGDQYGYGPDSKGDPPQTWKVCQFMVWDAFDGVLCAAHRVPQYERMADLSGVRFHAVLYSCGRLGEKGKDTAQYMQRHPASFSGNDRLLSAAQTIYVSYLLPLSICFPYGNGFGRVSASGSLRGACEAA